MTLANDRFHEQLMDYLYGGLEGESLREFEASLRASEQYRSELSAAQETLRLSREGLGALRERDQAPPTRVSLLVLAAAAEASGALAGAESAYAEPLQASRPHRSGSRDSSPARPSARFTQQREASSFWSFLRTPWLLPTLGVAAAVSVVVLHKQVESPKMPEYQAPTVQPAARDEPTAMPDLNRSGEAPPQAEPVEAPSVPASSGGPLAEGVGSGLSDAVEHKRDQVPARTRARAAPERPAPKVAASEGQAGKGYAVPPTDWPGRAREESAKKELGEARRASSSAVSAEKAEEYEAAPARDMGSDGFAARGEARGGGGVAAAKPVARARPTASQAAPAAPPSAPAASPPVDDIALAGAPTSSSAGARAELPRAPDEAVKKALEHMNARRFGQAAVAYRELLQRYPKDSRAAFFRSQLTAALAALSNVDAIR